LFDPALVLYVLIKRIILSQLALKKVCTKVNNKAEKSMSESYKPLFNRTYLKAILWIVAIVIVLLSAKGNNSTDYISIQKNNSGPVYFVDLDDAANLQLQLIFPLGAAITQDQQLLHQLTLDIAEQQLALFETEPKFQPLKLRSNILHHEDRLTIKLTIPKTELDNHQLIADLPQAVIHQLHNANTGIDLEARWNRLEAAQYLQRKDPEKQLLKAFGDQISSSGIHLLQRFNDYFRNSFNIAALSVTLDGPQSPLIAQAIANRLPGYQNSISLPEPIVAATTLRLSPVGNTPYSLAGRALPGRQQTNFAQELLTIQTIQSLLQQSGLQFRLVWKSLDKRGYLAMMLHGQNTPADLQQLQQQLQPMTTKLDTALIEATRSKIIERFRQQMAQQDSQLSLLNSVAFYQLPLDYMAQFEATLNQVDSQSVAKLVTDYLDTDQLHFIYLPAL